MSSCASPSATLETSKDPVEIIKAYKKYPTASDCSQAKTDIYLSPLTVVGTLGLGAPFLLGSLNTLRLCNTLSEPGTKFSCITGDSSDDCILWRRNTPDSDVGYFDYKRFLPNNSLIKTDDDFKKLVSYYNDNITQCNKMSDKTSEEKEACKETVANNTRTLAVSKVHCSMLYTEEYHEKLQETAKWYNWAINHDPNEAVRVVQYYAQTVSEWNSSKFYYRPVRSKSEALKETQDSLTAFAEEHFCTIDNWKQDLKKLGARM